MHPDRNTPSRNPVVTLPGPAAHDDNTHSKIKLLLLDSGRVETLNDSANLSQQPSTLNEPGGLALLGDSLLIADTNNHRIMTYDLKRKTLTEWKLHMPGDFDSSSPLPPSM